MVISGDEGELFVSTEEKFFLPRKGMEGRRVYIKGKVMVDTIPVETLQQQALNEGKNIYEAEKITDPKLEVNIKAYGVSVL